MTSCKEMADEKLQVAFGALLSGDFTPEEFRVANRHLAGCEVCRREYGELAAFGPRLRDVYGPAATSDRRMERRGWTLGGLALAASFLVGLAVWQAAPDPRILTASPQDVVVTTEATIAALSSAVYPEAAMTPSTEQSGAATISAADEPDLDPEEITDDELDQILYELGV